jgi:hypothetical protein
MMSHAWQGERIVRMSDLTERQTEALVAMSAARLVKQHRAARWTQKVITAWFIFAGILACEAIWAPRVSATLPPDVSELIPWYWWSVVFGLSALVLSIGAWVKFMMHEHSMRVAERAYVIMFFEKLAEERVELSAEDVVDFLKSAPDSMSLTKAAVG